MRIEQSYLELTSSLQWAYKLIGKMMWGHETIMAKEDRRWWKSSERWWPEKERGEGWGRPREIKGNSGGERLQGETNWTVAGFWMKSGSWEGDELHSNENILDLLLNYSGYLIGKFYLGVPLGVGDGLSLWQPVHYIRSGSWTRCLFIHVY